MSNYISKVQLTNNVVAEIKDANAQTSISNINGNIGTINGNIGTMSNLQTTDKTSLVNAINEVVTDVDNEAQARQNADTTLQQNIANEMQARQNADTDLQNQINIMSNGVIVDVTKNGVIGDGSTDNTSAIQTLLNDNAGVGALYFPNGIYVTNALTIPSNTIIWLDGTLKLKDGANSQLLYALTKENITIFGNGTLDGNKANQNSQLAISCILFGDASDTQYNVNNVLIDGITIKNALFWGACVIGDNCTFKNVTFADNEYMSFIGPHSKHGKFLNCIAYGVTHDWGLGFYGGVTDGIIDGCIAHNNNQCGLGALSDADQATPSNNIIITNCYCYDNGGVGIGVGGWSGLGYDFVICNNISKNNGLTIPTIYDCGGIFASFLRRATISNNTIYGNDGANNYGAGVILVGECTNIEIANNSIVSNNYGVLLTGAAMVGTNINNNNIRGAIPVSYTGVTACVDNIINSNIFDVNAAPYIPFAGDAAIHVKDNSNYKTCIYGRVSFPVDGIQRTFVITPASIGLKGNVANCIITPIKDYGETPLIDKGQALINITYTAAPPAGLGAIAFDYVITSDLY